MRHLHAAHGPALHAWLRTRTDEREVDDIVQEALILAWRKHDQFDPARGSERAWLFGIARNVAVDRHRRRQRHLRAVPSHELPDVGLEDVELERAVETSYVREALRSLSDAHRAVVVEAYYGGRTVREVAARLGIPEGTVKSRLHHAVHALRAELERQGVLR